MAKTTAAKYLSNVAKSVKYATVDVLKDMNPVIVDAVDTNKDIAKTVYTSIRHSRRTANKAYNAVMKSQIGELAKDLKKNMLSDLKSGKFYNREATDAAMDSIMNSDEFGGGDFGFDDDDLGFDDNISAGDEMLADTMDTVGERSSNAVGQVLLRTAEYQVEATRQSTAKTLSQQIIHTNTMHRDLSALNANVSNIMQMTGEALNTMAENSRMFYETQQRQMDEQTSILREMLELQKSIYKPTKTGSSTTRLKPSDIFSGSTINLANYLKYIQQNIKDSDMGMGGMMSMVMDSGMAKAAIANPMSYVLKFGIKKMIPEMLKESMAEFNKSLSGAMSTMLLNITKMQDSYNPILSKIGDILGFNMSLKKKLNVANYNKDPVPWNGKDHKALTIVIPDLLGKIYSSISGKPETIYDYEQGKFRSRKSIRESFNRERNRFTSQANSLLIPELEKQISYIRFNNDEERDRLLKSLDTLMKNNFEKMTYFNPNDKSKKAKDYGLKGDYADYDFELIRQMWKRIPTWKQLKANSDLIDAIDDRNEWMKRLEANGDSVYQFLFNKEEQAKLKKGEKPRVYQNPIVEKLETTNDILLDILHSINGNGQNRGSRNSNKKKKKRNNRQSQNNTGNNSNTNQNQQDSRYKSELGIIPDQRYAPNGQELYYALEYGADTDQWQDRPEQDTSYIRTIRNANTALGKLKAFTSGVKTFAQQPLKFVGNIMRTVDKRMYSLLFGDSGDHDSITARIKAGFDDWFSHLKRETSHRLDEIREAAGIGKKAKSLIHAVFGIDADKWVADFKEAMFGDRDKSFFGGMRDILKEGFGEIKNGFKKLFKPDSDDEDNISFKDILNGRLNETGKAKKKRNRDLTDQEVVIDREQREREKKKREKEAKRKNREDDGDDIEQAAKGMKRVAKTGIIAASEGELIVPPDMNPYNISNRNRREQTAISKFKSSGRGLGKIQSFAPGGIVDFSDGKYLAIANELNKNSIVNANNFSDYMEMIDTNTGDGYDVTLAKNMVLYSMLNNDNKLESVTSKMFNTFGEKFTDIVGELADKIIDKVSEELGELSGDDLTEEKLRKSILNANVQSKLGLFGEMPDTEVKLDPVDIDDIITRVRSGNLSTKQLALMADYRYNHGDKDFIKDVSSKLSDDELAMFDNEFYKHSKANRRAIKDDDFEEGHKSLGRRMKDEGKNIFSMIMNSDIVKSAQDKLWGIVDNDKAKDVKDVTKDFVENAKDYMPTMAAGGVAGMGLSLILGIAGGPILGGAVGAGLGLLSKSKKLQEWLFGNKITDEEGNTTRDGKGIIPTNIVNNIDKYFPNMAKGGIIGALAQILPITAKLLPGGPVAGIVIGSALGFARTNEEMRESLFGSGESLKKMKEKIQKMAPKMGIGAAGMLLAGPFGPVANLLLGAGLGFVSDTEKFKSIVFGHEGVDGKRYGGIVGHLKDLLLIPFKEAKKQTMKTLKWIKDGILKPIKLISKPMVQSFANFGNWLKHSISDSISTHIVKPFGQKLLKPLAKNVLNLGSEMFGAVLGFKREKATLPLKLLGAASDKFWRGAQLKKIGHASLTSLEGRIAERKARDEKAGNTNYQDSEAGRLDTYLANADKSTIENLMRIQASIDPATGKKRSTSDLEKHFMHSAGLDKLLTAEYNSHKFEGIKGGFDDLSDDIRKAAQKGNYDKAIAIAKQAMNAPGMSPEQKERMQKIIDKIQIAGDEAAKMRGTWQKSSELYNKLRQTSGIENIASSSAVETVKAAYYEKYGNKMDIDESDRKEQEKEKEAKKETRDHIESMDTSLSKIANLIEASLFPDSKGAKKTKAKYAKQAEGVRDEKKWAKKILERYENGEDISDKKIAKAKRILNMTDLSAESIDDAIKKVDVEDPTKGHDLNSIVQRLAKPEDLKRGYMLLGPDDMRKLSPEERLAYIKDRQRLQVQKKKEEDARQLSFMDMKTIMETGNASLIATALKGKVMNSKFGGIARKFNTVIRKKMKEPESVMTDNGVIKMTTNTQGEKIPDHRDSDTRDTLERRDRNSIGNILLGTAGNVGNAAFDAAGGIAAGATQILKGNILGGLFGIVGSLAGGAFNIGKGLLKGGFDIVNGAFGTLGNLASMIPIVGPLLGPLVKFLPMIGLGVGALSLGKGLITKIGDINTPFKKKDENGDYIDEDGDGNPDTYTVGELFKKITDPIVEKFKDILLGKEGAGGKRRGGVVGFIKDAFNEGLEWFGDHLPGWIAKGVWGIVTLPFEAMYNLMKTETTDVAYYEAPNGKRYPYDPSKSDSENVQDIRDQMAADGATEEQMSQVEEHFSSGENVNDKSSTQKAGDSVIITSQGVKHFYDRAQEINAPEFDIAGRFAQEAANAGAEDIIADAAEAQASRAEALYGEAAQNKYHTDGVEYYYIGPSGVKYDIDTNKSIEENIQSIKDTMFEDQLDLSESESALNDMEDALRYNKTTKSNGREGLSKKLPDEMYPGQAARGMKRVSRTGVVAVSEGEMIVPPDMNPYNIRKRDRNEKKAIDKFNKGTGGKGEIQSFAVGGVVDFDNDLNEFTGPDDLIRSTQSMWNTVSNKMAPFNRTLPKAIEKGMQSVSRFLAINFGLADPRDTNIDIDKIINDGAYLDKRAEIIAANSPIYNVLGGITGSNSNDLTIQQSSATSTTNKTRVSTGIKNMISNVGKFFGLPSASGSGIGNTEAKQTKFGGDPDLDTFVSQRYSSYSNKSFTTQGDNSRITISDAGCAPAAATMAINNTIATPITMNEAMRNAVKYKLPHGGVTADYFVDEFNRHGLGTTFVTDKSKNKDKVITDQLRKGNPIVLMGQNIQNRSKSISPFGPMEHYVVATGISPDGQTIYVNDPEAKSPNIGYNATQLLKDSMLGIVPVTNTKNNRPGALSRIKDALRGFSGRAIGDIIYVGDFRMIGLKSAVGEVEGVSFVYAANANLDWLKKNIAKVKEKTEANPDACVIFALGFKDLGNADLYTQYYDFVYHTLKARSVFFMSVNPSCDENSVPNSSICTFNETLKGYSLTRYIDTYNYLIDNGYAQDTGHQFDTETNLKIHQCVVDTVSKFNEKREKGFDLSSLLGIIEGLASLYGLKSTGDSESNASNAVGDGLNAAANIGSSAAGVVSGNVSSNKAVAEKQKQLVAKMASVQGQLFYSNSSRNPDNGSGDCSSTVDWAYQNIVGRTVGSCTSDQRQHPNTYVVANSTDDESKLQLGDLILKKGHVEMYAGNGQMIGHGGPGYNDKGPQYHKLGEYAGPYDMVRRLNEFAPGSTYNGSGSGIGFVSQYDSSFNNIKFGDSTVAEAGCAPVVAAMAEDAYDMDTLTTAGTKESIRRAIPYKIAGSGVSADYFMDEFSRKGYSSMVMQNQEGIINSLRKDNSVILLGTDSTNKSKSRSPFGPNSHYVLATGISDDGQTVYINDPEANKGNIPYRLRDVMKSVRLGIMPVVKGAYKKIDELANKYRSALKRIIGRGEYGPDTVQYKVWHVLRGAGYLEAAVAAVMGNIQRESEFDPAKVEAGSGRGFGLVQWTGSRRTDLENYAKTKNMDPASLQLQLDFLISELNGTSAWSGKSSTAYDGKSYTKDDWQYGNDLYKTTVAFMTAYERPAVGSNPKEQIQKRVDAATEYYNAFHGQAIDTNAMTTSNIASAIVSAGVNAGAEVGKKLISESELIGKFDQLGIMYGLTKPGDENGSNTSIPGANGSGYNGTGVTPSLTNGTNFPKYSLNAETFSRAVDLVTRECGGSDIVAARQEASQIVNLNETQKKRQNTSEDLMATMNGGWYASKTNGGHTSEISKQAVMDVMVGGKRTLPRYVVEHDMFPGDIINPKERSQYQYGDEVTNKYGGTYRYYTFFGKNPMNSKSDIAGWYDKYKNDTNKDDIPWAFAEGSGSGMNRPKIKPIIRGKGSSISTSRTSVTPSYDYAKTTTNNSSRTNTVVHIDNKSNSNNESLLAAMVKLLTQVVTNTASIKEIAALVVQVVELQKTVASDKGTDNTEINRELLKTKAAVLKAMRNSNSMSEAESIQQLIRNVEAIAVQ